MRRRHHLNPLDAAEAAAIAAAAIEAAATAVGVGAGQRQSAEWVGKAVRIAFTLLLTPKR